MGLETCDYHCLRQQEIIMSKGILYLQKDEEDLEGIQDLQLFKGFR